jgi:hypothetical protein
MVLGCSEINRERMTEMIDASWVVVDRRTGTAICELFDPELVMMVNIEKYEIRTIREYLAGLNRR